LYAICDEASRSSLFVTLLLTAAKFFETLAWLEVISKIGCPNKISIQSRHNAPKSPKGDLGSLKYSISPYRLEAAKSPLGDLGAIR